MRYYLHQENFLGTLAGTEATIESHESENRLTAGRVLMSNCADELRKDIDNAWNSYHEFLFYCRYPETAAKGLNYGDKCQKIGEALNGKGTIFKTTYICTEDAEILKPSLNCFGYALQSFGRKLEILANQPMKEIVASVRSSIDSVVTNSFEPITDKPQDGDLVIYQNRNENTHAGIYRDTKAKNSPEGGTVESKWGFRDNKYVFQHDMFFAPEKYGDIVKFYRLKDVDADLFDLLGEGYFDGGHVE